MRNRDKNLFNEGFVSGINEGRDMIEKYMKIAEKTSGFDRELIINILTKIDRDLQLIVEEGY
jgi:hypothetical protein